MTSFFLLLATIKSMISKRYLLLRRNFLRFRSVFEYPSVVSNRTANSLCFIFIMMTFSRLPSIMSRFFCDFHSLYRI